MGTCRECGKPLDKDQAFRADHRSGDSQTTNTCSTGHVCSNCGAVMPSENKACLVCHAKRTRIDYPGEFPVKRALPQNAYPKWEGSRDARRVPELWRKWGRWTARLILIALVMIGGFHLYKSYFDTSKYLAGEAILYEEDGQIMLTYPEAVRPVKVLNLEETVLLDGGVQTSSSGRWMALTGQSGALYLLDFADLADEEGDEPYIEASLLTEGLAASAVFSDTGGYLVYLNNSGGLYASNLDTSWQLDTGVVEVIAVEGQRVLYMRRGDAVGQLDLYLDYLPKNGGEWHVVDRDVSEVLDWSNGFETLLYTGERTQDSGETVTCVQMFKLDSASITTVAAGVGRVLDASANSETVIYLSEPKHTWRYTDFIQDDRSASDALMAEPQIADYPQAQQILAWYGGDEAALLAGLEKDEELAADYEPYRQAVEAWEDKLERDALRESFKESVKTIQEEISLCELYVCRRGTQTLIDANVLDSGNLSVEDGTVSIQKNYMTYQRCDLESLYTVRLSTIWENEADTFDLAQYFSENMHIELCFCTTTGSPALVDQQTAAVAAKQWRVSNDVSSVYFVLSDVQSRTGKTQQTLYYAPLDGGQDAAVVMQDVSAIQASLQEGILFTARDRAYYARQDKTLALSAALPLSALPQEDQPWLYYGEDGDDGSAPLYMMPQTEQLIADQAVDFWRPRTDSVYFARPGAEEGTFDLCLWQAGKETLIAENMRVISSNEESEYSLFE